MNSMEVGTNSTTRFLLPIVFPNTTYDELLANGFIKAYIGMLDDDQYDDSLLLLFDKEDINEEALADLFEHTDTDVLDNQDSDLIIVVVNDWLDFLGEKEYKHFLSGEWSKFSEENKKHILSFWGEISASLLYMILYKDPKFKDIIQDLTSTLLEGQMDGDVDNNEYWPKPDIVEDELYFSGDH